MLAMARTRRGRPWSAATQYVLLIWCGAAMPMSPFPLEGGWGSTQCDDDIDRSKRAAASWHADKVRQQEGLLPRHSPTRSM